MIVFDLTNAGNTRHRVFLTDHATEGITRIGWIYNHPTGLKHSHGLTNQTRLWIYFVYIKKTDSWSFHPRSRLPDPINTLRLVEILPSSIQLLGK